MSPSSKHEALVIGAGISGAAAAYGLAKRGIRVTVVDDEQPGQATNASAGIIEPWTYNGDGPFYELYHAGAAFYPQLLQELRDIGVHRTDFRRSGALIVNRDHDLLQQAAARVSARARRTPQLIGSVDFIDDATAHRLFPPLAPDLEAVHIEGGARVDGRTMRDALLQGARVHGAQVATGTVELRASGDTVRAFLDGRATPTDHIVVSAGAWSVPLLAPLGVRLAVAPQRGQITHLRLAGVETDGWPTIHPLSHHYIVAFDNGRVAVGATRETGSGFDPRVTAAGQAQVLNDALSIAPGLADASLIETRVGLRPLPDGTLPSVGPAPGFERLFVATGYGAAGLTMGPMLGDALARQICGEQVPELADTPVVP